MATKKAANFEKSLGELEKLVEAMEQGDISLEESLKAFEKGVKLSRECQEALSSAEQRVQTLIEANGEILTEPFSEE